MVWFALFTIFILPFIVGCYTGDSFDGFITFLVTAFIWVVVAIVLGVIQNNDPEVIAQKAAEQKARETPHVIRDSGDGCKVYAFEASGRTHYFTRCLDSKVVTEGSYEVSHSCGKNCTKKEIIVEKIETK